MEAERGSELKTQVLLPTVASLCLQTTAIGNVSWFLQAPGAVTGRKERCRGKEKLVLHFDDLKAFSMFILFRCRKVQLVN